MCLLAFICLTASLGQADESGQTLTQQNDQAASLIRQAWVAPTIPQRNHLVDEALVLLNDIISDPTADEQARLRARYDRILALRTREDMDAVLENWNSLLNEGREPPEWVVVAAADALLYQREPEQAAELYRQILSGNPERLDIRQSLFWAQLEQEDFDGALETIDILVTHPDVKPGSELHRDARITAAMGRAYANRLADAQERLESVVVDHPDSDAALRALATVERWRGWSRKALERAERLLEEDPDNTENRLLHAALLRDLGQFEEVDNELTRLHIDHPEDRSVQQDYDDWLTRDRWSISAGAEFGNSNGVNEFGSRDRHWNMRLSAPWMGHYLQPYAFSTYSNATFPEGDASYDRIGAGARYHRGNHVLTVEAGRNRKGDHDTGITAGYDFAIDDHWSVAARYESFSTDVPLRARGQGLDGWKAEAAVRWQAHESLGIRFGISRLAISDGNNRDSVLISLNQRIHASAHHITYSNVDLYASRGSQTGGWYFNPKRDASLTWVLKHDWLTWRRYEKSLTQRFTVGAGEYWQHDHGANVIWLARYEHLWQVSSHWFITYGVGVSSRVYDGNRESRVNGTVLVRGVF